MLRNLPLLDWLVYEGCRTRSNSRGRKCLLWHHVCPKGEFRRAAHEHLIRDGGEVVDETEIGLGEDTPLRLRIYSQFRERELASLAP